MSTISCFITSASPTLPYFRRRQWGFLPERSAQSALLSVTHNWFQQLQWGLPHLFRFKKAFDSIPQSVLLQKLSDIGFDSFMIQRIRNYLTCRSQYVVVGGEQSCVLPVMWFLVSLRAQCSASTSALLHQPCYINIFTSLIRTHPGGIAKPFHE